MNKEQKATLIKQLAENPIKDSEGKHDYKKMLASVGLPNICDHREALAEAMGATDYVRTRRKTPSIQITSMPLGPRAIKLGWELCKQPAIYEIVCLPTGRRYIGSSSRPDLRRAVHLYWLKNYWKYGCSNIFFGSLALKADVEKYGPNSFTMDIIKSIPGATRNILNKEERKILETLDKSQLYNKYFLNSAKHKTSVFLEIEPEYAEFFRKFHAFNAEFSYKETEYLKFRNRTKKIVDKIKENKLTGKITPGEYRNKLEAKAVETRLRRAEIQAMHDIWLKSKEEFRVETKKLIKKYSTDKKLY